MHLQTLMWYDPPNFAIQAMERLPGMKHDRIRYARHRLLDFRSACTEAPEELLNSEMENLATARFDTRSNSSQSEIAPAGLPPAIAKKVDSYMAGRGAQVELNRKVNRILSKLTPENYDLLAEQIVQAGISSPEDLVGVTSLIHHKAVLKPALYAPLCAQLIKTLPEFPGEQTGGKPITFRWVLLNMCQEVFEGANALREKIKKLTKPEQAVERDEKEKRVKLRTLGNIKLIGELFKQKILTEKIVQECIHKLLEQDPKAIPAEENVEALCHLFTTVGKQLEESAKSKMAFDTYFARLKVIGESRALPSRIRFMVRDILDMRSDKWVPRREEVKAKTINEIHAEAEAKLGLRPGKMALWNGRAAAIPGFMPGARGIMPGIPGVFGMPGGGGGMPGAPMMGSFMGPGLEADGWETVSNLRKGRKDGTGVLPVPGFGGKADLTKKSESLLKEYFSIVDLNEALICVQELKSPSFHPEFVRLAIATVLDMREKECSLVLKLLLHLQSNGVISISDLRGGVLLVTEGLEDMAIVAPLAPKQLGGMLAGLVLSGAVELRLVQEAALKLEDEFLQKDVLKAVVAKWKLKENEVELGEVCRKASVNKEGLLSVAVASDVAKLMEFGDCRAPAMPELMVHDNFDMRSNKDDFNLRGLLQRVQMYGK